VYRIYTHSIHMNVYEMSNWTEGNIFINNIYLADFYLNVYAVYALYIMHTAIRIINCINITGSLLMIIFFNILVIIIA